MAVIEFPGEQRPVTLTPIVASHADYRPSDFFFPRTQSPMMRSATWEHRVRPLRSWGQIAASLGTILAATLLLVVLV